MKKFKKIYILILLLYFIGGSCAFAQNNYSPRAIQIYNLAAVYQNQGKYELAEKQYKMALSLQPNFAEAKHNLATLYYNSAIRNYNNSNYSKTVYYARESLQLKPNNADMYTMIGDSFLKLQNNDKAITAYEKVITLDSKNTSAMHSIAQIYLLEHKYAEAAPFYRKILAIDPNDRVAKQNSRYVNQQQDERNLNESLNCLKVDSKAPIAVYKLIKPVRGISQETVEQTKVILDLIWSDPSGRIILTALLNAKVPININQNAFDANATKTQKENTLYLYGFIPVYTYKRTAICVNIPGTYVNNFSDTRLSSNQRIYSFHVFVHEFCHAFRNLKYPQAANSIEEELGASMIGTNIAYKVITDEYMTRSQTETYSMAYLKSLLGDSHRNLPVYSGFPKYMQMQGVIMPYPEVYANLVKMYKVLLNEGQTSQVPSFVIYLR